MTWPHTWHGIDKVEWNYNIPSILSLRRGTCREKTPVIYRYKPDRAETIEIMCFVMYLLGYRLKAVTKQDR